MGLFKDPRRVEGDTKGSYSRRRAPWLVLAALGCTYYVFTLPNPTSSAWIAMGVVWIAALLSVATADWSDLRK